MKSKLSEVRVVCILVIDAFDFFLEEGFRGETFLFFEGSSSSLGGVTSPFFCSTSVPSISPPSPPFSGEIEEVFVEVLLHLGRPHFSLSCWVQVYHALLQDCQYQTSPAGSTGMRRSTD
jgi:hypothetical protein